MLFLTLVVRTRVLGKSFDDQAPDPGVRRGSGKPMKASRFKPWKTGALFNYFHIGLGARLVYDYESERRHHPESFKSREANNNMYMCVLLDHPTCFACTALGMVVCTVQIASASMSVALLPLLLF